jgi:hypothetical protein
MVSLIEAISQKKQKASAQCAEAFLFNASEQYASATGAFV